jgi:hypothetical protein
VTPMTATGFRRRQLSGKGRAARSSAFLRAPGFDALYSGVAISTASDRAISSRSSLTAAGTASRSSLYGGRSARPRHTTNSTFREQALAAPAAWSCHGADGNPSARCARMSDGERAVNRDGRAGLRRRGLPRSRADPRVRTQRDWTRRRRPFSLGCSETGRRRPQPPATAATHNQVQRSGQGGDGPARRPFAPTP